MKRSEIVSLSVFLTITVLCTSARPAAGNPYPDWSPPAGSNVEVRTDGSIHWTGAGCLTNGGIDTCVSASVVPDENLEFHGVGSITDIANGGTPAAGCAAMSLCEKPVWLYTDGTFSDCNIGGAAPGGEIFSHWSTYMEAQIRWATYEYGSCRGLPKGPTFFIRIPIPSAGWGGEGGEDLNLRVRQVAASDRELTFDVDACGGHPGTYTWNVSLTAMDPSGCRGTWIVPYDLSGFETVSVTKQRGGQMRTATAHAVDWFAPNRLIDTVSHNTPASAQLRGANPSGTTLRYHFWCSATGVDAQIEIDPDVTVSGDEATYTGCGAYHEFDREYPEVKVTYRFQREYSAGHFTRASFERRMAVQDWLVVGLGDSVASGEGIPDQGNRFTDQSCHRSMFSHQREVARRLESWDWRTSVTFVHLACSGARIRKGMIDPQTEAGTTYSQLDDLQRIVGDREIDVLLLSVGANDIGFGNIVRFCTLPHGINSLDGRNCQTKPGYTHAQVSGTPASVTDELSRDLLPSHYQEVAGRLESLVFPERVFLTEYFDPTHGPGGPCEMMTVSTGALVVTQVMAGTYARIVASQLGVFPEESAWARAEVLGPLNAAGAQAAVSHGWRQVTGVASAFATRGYCANSAQRWVVTLPESYVRQLDPHGAVHPNRDGQDAIADRAFESVFLDLYPGFDEDTGNLGAPRLPSH